ncbi:glycine-rich domain-containing protein-like [Anabaena sp. UHCC 0253]|uniref:glycine-rich domain-containing protein n=1 Tax=Anabaena sp. UHCC 0253 TaxID=2590019 RepID=UPI00158127FE|nr:hypothetical protein [Anabaena sp. UHCC 0253]MTJ55934.1 glycine-rich domain-containing protein-like [Anabaena sp. UHCC 0253]
MNTRTLALSPEGLHFLQKLKQLDLGAIAYKLICAEEGKGWTKQQTTQALLRYMMFLFLLNLYPNQNIIPTTEIDQVWHHHILVDVNKYIKDCEMLFGRLINHSSYPQSENDINTWQVNLDKTQELFQKHFELELFAEVQENKPGTCQPHSNYQPLESKKNKKSLDFKIPAIDDYLTT